MKLAVIYHSESGNTAKAAEFIKEGMLEVEGTEVNTYSIKEIKGDELDGVVGVVFGAPTYYAEMSWQMLQFLEETALPLSDKLGAAFSTAGFEQGGSELVMQNMNSVMLAKGMTVYSGGTSHGDPFTHIGANAFGGRIEERAEVLRALGRKFAAKAQEYFG